MSKSAPIPVPDAGNLLKWAIANPQAAPQAVQAVNLLLGLQVRVTRAGVSALNQQQSLLISGEVIQLPLPLLWPAGVPSNVATYSGTASGSYTQAELQAVMTQLAAVTTTLNQILTGERAVQTLPGSG